MITRWRTRWFAASAVLVTVGALAAVSPPSTPMAQASVPVNELVADANTVLLDHFNESTVGTAVGSLSYATSQTGMGQAGVFGPGNYVKYGPYGSVTNAGTVEMWVQPASLPEGPTDGGVGLLTFNWYNTGSPPCCGGYVLHLGISYPATITKPAYTPGAGFWGWNGSGYADGDSQVEVGEWTHLAVTWSPTDTKFYINGVLSSGPNGDGPPAINWGYWAYLNYWGLAGSAFSGLIDEFRISDIQRSAAEILADATVGDTTPPDVVVTTPADGATYQQGATVFADYGCTDAESGIATCDGPVASGAAIDTSALGSQVFTVTATNNAGLVTTVANTYTVVLADTTTALSVSPDTTVTYGTDVTLDATVAAVASGAGTPTGSVRFTVGSDTYTVALSGGTASKTLSLGAGDYTVAADYLGDVGFAPSSSEESGVTVNPASTSVGYGGSFWAYLGNPLGLKATVSSEADSCLNSRTVTFTLTPVGGGTPQVVTGSTNLAGVATANATGLASGEYELTVDVAATSNCTAASAGDIVVTVADPGDAATGGGWYLLPVTGPKHANFGFNVKKVTGTTTYRGNLLLIQQSKFRIKGSITTYGKTGSTGVTSGTGVLYTYNPITYQWVNPQAVSFTIKFVDNGTGKKIAPDKFGVVTLNVSGTQLLSVPQELKGGDVRVG